MIGAYQILGLGAPCGVPGSDGRSPFRAGDFDNVKTTGAVLTWLRHGGRALAKVDDGTLRFFTDRDGALCFSAAIRPGVVLEAAIRAGDVGCSVACTTVPGAGHSVVGKITEIAILFSDGRHGCQRPALAQTGAWFVGGAGLPEIVMDAYRAATRHTSAAPKPPRQQAGAPRQRARTLGGSPIPPGMLARVEAAQARFLPPADVLASMGSRGCIIDRSVMAAAGIGQPQRRPSPRRGR
jgi:hypothetical protein